MIKIEYMTSEQIDELRKIIAEDVKDFLSNIQRIASQNYDCGTISFQVDTEEIPAIMSEQGQVVVPPKANYDVTVQFSKEKEYE